MLPICAIIIFLAPFSTLSQPQISLLTQSHNNALLYTSLVNRSMIDANTSVADFHFFSKKEEAGQAISPLRIVQAKPKLSMLPKAEAEQGDAVVWDIVTSKENGTAALYSLSSKFFNDPTSSALFRWKLDDVLAILLFMDIFGLSWYLDRGNSLKIVHIALTYAMAYCLLLK
ncbi:hypothetical protein PS15p_205621 [Mucor circinelloides]